MLKPRVSDVVVSNLLTWYPSGETRQTLLDLQDARRVIAAWTPTMLCLGKWVARNLVPPFEPALTLEAKYRAIPRDLLPEPEWEPSAEDVRVVMDGPLVIGKALTPALAEAILKALHDAGRLK